MMFSFIRKRLELKIILTVTIVIACMMGFLGYVDVKDMRQDTINTSERTLGAFAAAIKGSVITAMKKGHHQDTRHLLEEVNTPYFIDRVLVYDEQGRPLSGVEKLNDNSLDMNLPPGIVTEVLEGDMSRITEQGGTRFISYYSPVENRRECFRCHGTRNRLNGILRVDFSLHDLDDLITARRNHVVIWSLQMIVFLSVILAVLQRTLIYRPLRELRDAMARVRDGFVPPPLSTSGEDELADLKKSFVSMIDRINTLHQKNLDKEKELVHNEENVRFRKELQTMFDAMPDGVLLIDSDMKIVQGNPRAHKLIPGLEPVGGYVKPNCLRKECCPFQGIEAALREGRTVTNQCSLVLRNQETRHLQSICAPIMEEGRVGYAVQVIRDITEQVRTERELEEKTGQLLAANRLLSQMAITDSLTQVSNRRHLDEFLFKEIKRFNRRKYSHLSVLMVDIDHFKDLNDRYGHLAGDGVLREIATMLREHVRETDTVARYGGEEFVIVMPDTHLNGAAYVAEALRKRIEAKEFPGRIRTTISIGVAAYVSGTPQSIIQSADQALYRAKKAGRNRVVVDRLEHAANDRVNSPSEL